MKKELITRLHKSFEKAVHHRGRVEYWLARELQQLLGYTQWRNFERVIEEAKTALRKGWRTGQGPFCWRQQNGRHRVWYGAPDR